MGAADSGEAYWQTCLDRALEGDHEAFGELWQEYLRPQKVLPYAAKLLKNPHDAEDVSHDVFLYLYDQAYYRTIRRRDLDGFTLCVCKMTYNMAMDHFRRHKRTRFVITSQTLEQLKLSGVSEDVLALLETLQRERPVGRQKFVDLLASLLRKKFTAWLKGIILKYSRYEYARWEPYSDDILPRGAEPRNPQAECEYTELLQIVEEVRSQISEDEWEVLYHKHTADNFSYQKYSEETGIPVTTLHSRYQRAREKILTHKKVQGYWKQ